MLPTLADEPPQLALGARRSAPAPAAAARCWFSASVIAVSIWKSLSSPNSVSTACTSPLPRRPAASTALARFEQHGVALIVLDDAEIERHAGFAREAVQHALAEGVDGLDLEPARRFERMGEQRPRPQFMPGVGAAPVSSSISAARSASFASAQRPSRSPTRLRISAAAALV